MGIDEDEMGCVPSRRHGWMACGQDKNECFVLAPDILGASVPVVMGFTV